MREGDILSGRTNTIIGRLLLRSTGGRLNLNSISDPRYRRVALTFLASGGASAATIISSFVTVPVLLHYLGSARFGLWMVLYSFISMLSFLDMGIGLGLLTALAHCYGANDRIQARRYVSSAIVVSMAIGILLFLAFAVIYPFIPWDAVFNIRNSGLEAEAKSSVLVLAACLLLAIPTSLPARVQAGYQRGYVASLWDFFARMIILFGIVGVARWNANIPVLIGVAAGIPAVIGLINGVVFFNFHFPWLRPSASAVDLAAANWILRKGVLFLVLQVVSAIAFASDDIVIAQIFGPQMVAIYAVPRTLFQMLAGVVSLFLAPLWPAYGEALAKGERGWVVRTLKRSFWTVGVISVLGGLILVLFGKTILARWTGTDLHVSYWLLSGFAFWTILNAFGGAIGMLMNAASIIRFQVITASLLAICAICTKIAFATWFGIDGVIWGTVAAYAFVSVLPCLIYIRRWLAIEHAGLH